MRTRPTADMLELHASSVAFEARALVNVRDVRILPHLEDHVVTRDAVVDVSLAYNEGMSGGRKANAPQAKPSQVLV